MRRIIYILFIFLSYFSVTAQEITPDNLHMQIENAKNDTIRLGHMLDAVDLLYGNNPDSALHISYAAEKMAMELKDNVSLARIEREIARLLRKTGDYVNSMAYIKKALNHEMKIGNKTNISKAHNIIGVLYYEQSNFVDALKHYLQSLKIYEETQNKDGIASIYNNLGLLYKEKGSIEIALKYYLKSLEINKSLNDSIGLAYCYNNLGVISRNKGDYIASLDYLNKSLEIKKKLGNADALASSFMNIGVTLNKQGHFDKALKVILEALEINEKLGDLPKQAQNYNILAETYLKMGVPYKSIPYGEKAYSIAKTVGQIRIMRDASEIQYKAFKQMSNYEDALQQLEITQSLRDSLVSVQKVEELSNLRSNYEIEKQQLEIESLNKDKIIQDDRIERQALQRNVLVVVLTFFAIIVSILVKNNRRSKKNNDTLTQKHKEIEHKNNELARLNQEIVNQNVNINVQKNNLEELNQIKNNLFTIVSHDFRSPLKSIQGFLNLLQLGALTQEEMHKMLEDLKVKVDMTADFLENLLTWARNQMQKIESKPESIHLQRIAMDNISLVKPMADKKNVTLELDVPENIEAFADANMINLVVRNLVVNAIKFTSEGDLVKLSAIRDGAKVIFSVEDTGIGIDSEIINKLFNLETYSTSGTANEKGTGLGLILCKEFVEKNNGRIWAESKLGKGSIFSFSIPLTPAEKSIPITA